MALLVLGVGLACSVLLYAGVRHLEHEKADLAFRQQARGRIMTLQQQLQDTEQVLRVLNQLFVAVEPVSREQFRSFTRPLLERHPYLQAFNFHRIVAGEERETYEHGLRDRFPGFELKELKNGRPVPAVMRDRHYVVEYIEPAQGNEAAFGLDVAGNPLIMEAAQRAIDTGRPASTPPLILAQGDGKPRGLLLVMPVYRHGMPLETVSQRRAAAIGDVAAVFDATALVGNILAANAMLDHSGIDLAVYAGPEASEEHLAFRTGENASDAGHADRVHWLGHESAGRVEHGFEVAGRPWRVVATPAPDFFAHEHGRSLNVIIGSLLLTLLIAAYLHAMASRARRVHALVEQRTAELRHANDMLVHDIAARRKVEEALQLRQRAIEASANGIIITSAEGPGYPIQYVNPAFERMTGYHRADVLGRSGSLLWRGDSDQPEVRELVAAAAERREAHVILRAHARDGRLFWAEVFISPVRDEKGEATHFVVAMYDITATRRYQAELEYQANRDAVTGLANRSLLDERLRQAIALSQRQGEPFWLLFLNLDRFKFVNDTLGHRAGDRLLREVGERLRAAVADTDTVARMSADEFMLLLPQRRDDKLCAATVRRLMDAVAQPIEIDGYRFVMGSSVGVAVYPEDGSEPDTLIKHAGVAMYRAKDMGRNAFQFFTSAMNERAMERLRIEGDLREALQRGELRLHYQPQVDLRSGRVIGMEALIRWQHPELGMIPPGRFIQLAEELGLIVPIGSWVLRTACSQSVAWREQGLGDIRVAVNLSARQFYQQNLVATIEEVLTGTGIAPHLLELELTESMMMNDVEHAVGILHELKQLGVQLSIDDFGTGYSSLAYLKRFPIDLLKIDQSFVRDITLDADDAAIVLSVISLAHSLRLKVIAEGVETAAQLRYLREHGCDCMQGYFFSPPLPAADAERLLREGKHLADGEARVVMLRR
ncbi:bifunctional diguanylate cyclase/phosphodiesterase [Noviherbaspirillum aridicola]|uniref:PAS domain S-box-containing protein/diguanylate cyclase (GGDEF)-like protein n=1 Tax=Noviherbaspirillum aridicola TaxID=2849687 RepID=A0ABQ4Q2J8_9BURK|nr:EAL domain-containing protein [Noviherbaspirillum aridicola]GIZ51413.1 hypothetical protein NCCP691_14270 [Noviherbaspirillum aridicola]